MNEELARKILKDAYVTIGEDNSLEHVHCLVWSPGDENIALDDAFNAETLEALAWWMKNTR